MSRRAKLGIFWLFLVGFIVVDQAVKAWVRGALPEGGSYHALPWPGVFEITLTYNQGIAFGMLKGFGSFLAPVAIVIACGSVWYVHRNPREGALGHAAFGLLASGALGNLIDRVLRGRVTDMFYFRPINFPVFNVADSCITVATILLIIVWWIDASHNAKKAPTSA